MEQAWWCHAGCRCRVLLLVLLLKWACWSRCSMPLHAAVGCQGAAAGCPTGCCFRVLLSKGVCDLGACWCRVRFGAGVLVPLQGAASGCCGQSGARALGMGAAAGCRAGFCFRVLLLKWPPGAAGCRAAVRVVCAFCHCRTLLQGAAAGCRCRVLLDGAATAVVCTLWRCMRCCC